MINANELRIGNWVDGGFNFYYQIKPSDFENTNFNITNPIPLTPEILVKAGFKFSPCGISGCDMWQGMAFWRHENLDLRGSVSTFNGGTLRLGGYFNSRIEYLHQLQNLYWCLVGEELSVNFA